MTGDALAMKWSRVGGQYVRRVRVGAVGGEDRAVTRQEEAAGADGTAALSLLPLQLWRESVLGIGTDAGIVAVVPNAGWALDGSLQVYSPMGVLLGVSEDVTHAFTRACRQSKNSRVLHVAVRDLKVPGYALPQTSRQVVLLLREDGSLETYGLLQELFASRVANPSRSSLAPENTRPSVLQQRESIADCFFLCDGELVFRTHDGQVFYVPDPTTAERIALVAARTLPPDWILKPDPKRYGHCGSSSGRTLLAFESKVSSGSASNPNLSSMGDPNAAGVVAARFQKNMMMIDRAGNLVNYRAGKKEVYTFEISSPLSSQSVRARTEETKTTQHAPSSASASDRGSERDACMMLALSPCTELVAIALRSRRLVVRSTRSLGVDSCEAFLPNQQNAEESSVYALLWCGSDAVLAAYDSTLVLLTRDGSLHTLRLGAPMIAFGERDCARLFFSRGVEIVEFVDDAYRRVFARGSDHPGAILFSLWSGTGHDSSIASSAYERYEALRLLHSEQNMFGAAETCAQAAKYEWEFVVQLALLRAVNSSISFSVGLDAAEGYIRGSVETALVKESRQSGNINSGTEEQISAFRKMLPRIMAASRILHSIRHAENVGCRIPLSSRQFEAIGPFGIIDRLSQMHEYSAALFLSLYCGSEHLEEVLCRWLVESMSKFEMVPKQDAGAEARKYWKVISRYWLESSPPRHHICTKELFRSRGTRAHSTRAFAAKVALEKNLLELARGIMVHPPRILCRSELELLLRLEMYAEACAAAFAGRGDVNLLWTLFEFAYLSRDPHGTTSVSREAFDRLDAQLKTYLAQNMEAYRMFVDFFEQHLVSCGPYEQQTVDQENRRRLAEASQVPPLHSTFQRFLLDTSAPTSALRLQTDRLFQEDYQRRTDGQGEAASMSLIRQVQLLERAPSLKYAAWENELSILKLEAAVGRAASKLEALLSLPLGSLAGSSASDLISIALSRLDTSAKGSSVWPLVLGLQKELKIPDRRFCWICLQAGAAKKEAQIVLHVAFNLYGARGPPVGLLVCNETLVQMGAMEEAKKMAMRIRDPREQTLAFAQSGMHELARNKAAKLGQDIVNELALYLTS
ncbi:Protein VACUOLELESS1 [Porphyridium purpureum]|uniref:Protein VACUOLELESS1 n=1 Tax=Porphyridium purpureum TaxID=35688 RepID=A0A5J4Z5P3_PORPP|nr:Protein VACUOLELESS1 [Porphyridium purpureum]|eukprot:POR1832..scf295_1